MMRFLNRSTQGFSAVELLITLFIATAFVATGYQLYSVVIRDSENAREQAQASNIAYNALRQYSPQATNPCTAVTPTPTPSIPSGSNLPNPSISVTITCPYGTSIGITKVTATVSYGNPQVGVVHALFVND
jgi:Tfp pilus assembly protein PilV